MVGWVFAIGLFCVISAVQFGGLLDVENGSGVQQFLGLLATLALFLGLVFVLKLVLGGFEGAMGVLGATVLPIALPLAFLGWIGRVGFRLCGVRLSRVPFEADAH
jgi:hypothetical protein